MKLFLSLTLWLALTNIALGQQPEQTPALTVTAEAPAPVAEPIDPEQNALLTTEVPAPPKPLLERLTDGTFLTELVLIFGSLLALLRGIAECLTRLSARFPGVSKMAKLASDGAWILGAFIGKFGVSEPKLVTEEKAKALVEKGVVHGPDTKATEPPKAG